jgi:hypothetical protein
MDIRVILILCFSTLVSCTPFSSNFKVTTDMKEVTFRKLDLNEDMSGSYVYNTFVDTTISFQIISKSKNEIRFFHDKTFIIPNEIHFSPLLFNEYNTVIRYYDINMDEVYGSYSSGYIDTLNADPEIFTPEFIDTVTYDIKQVDTLKIIQKLKLPYKENTYLISLDKDVYNEVKFMKLCISQGKKGKNKYFGFSCSDVIHVVHRME